MNVGRGKFVYRYKKRMGRRDGFDKDDGNVVVDRGRIAL